jgi:hypothetical protein
MSCAALCYSSSGAQNEGRCIAGDVSMLRLYQRPACRWPTQLAYVCIVMRSIHSCNIIILGKRRTGAGGGQPRASPSDVLHFQISNALCVGVVNAAFRNATRVQDVVVIQHMDCDQQSTLTILTCHCHAHTPHRLYCAKDGCVILCNSTTCTQAQYERTTANKNLQLASSTEPLQTAPPTTQLGTTTQKPRAAQYCN